MPTSRNARGIDILVYNLDASEVVSIQVKALSKRAPVPLGNDLKKLMGDFWIIVSNLENNPECYILSPEEVKAASLMRDKEGKVSYWLPLHSYQKPEFREAWSRIGIPHPNPLESDY
jgi:hypothetical protein